jgi:hypothetical protein
MITINLLDKLIFSTNQFFQLLLRTDNQIGLISTAASLTLKTYINEILRNPRPAKATLRYRQQS